MLRFLSDITFAIPVISSEVCHNNVTTVFTFGKKINTQDYNVVCDGKECLTFFINELSKSTFQEDV